MFTLVNPHVTEMTVSSLKIVEMYLMKLEVRPMLYKMSNIHGRIKSKRKTNKRSLSVSGSSYVSMEASSIHFMSN